MTYTKGREPYIDARFAGKLPPVVGEAFSRIAMMSGRVTASA